MTKLKVFRSTVLSIILLAYLYPILAQIPSDCLKPKVWKTSKGEETHLAFRTTTGEKKLDLLAMNPYQFEELEAIFIHGIYNTPVYKVDRKRFSEEKLDAIFGGQRTELIESLRSQVSVIKEQNCYTIVIYGVQGVASMGLQMDTVLAFSSTILVFDNLTGELKATIQQEGVGNYNPKILANGAYLITEVYPLNEYADQAVARIYSIENEALAYELGWCLNGRDFLVNTLFDTKYFLISLSTRNGLEQRTEEEILIVDPYSESGYAFVLDKFALDRYRGFTSSGIRLLSIDGSGIEIIAFESDFTTIKVSRK